MKNYPALAGALVQTVLAVVLSFGIFHWSAGTVGAIQAAVVAAVGLVVAVNTHEPVQAALIALVNAGFAVGIAFNVPHIQPGTAALVNAVIAAGFALFTHQVSTPKTRPVPLHLRGL